MSPLKDSLSSPLNINSQLLELMPVAVYVCDVEGRITNYNKRARELWGRDPDERDRFCASTKVILKDGTLAPNSHTPMAVALSDGTSFRDLDVYARRSDGGIGHGLVNIDAIRDQSGKVIGAINVVQDVTTIHENQEIFATIFEQAAIGIVLLNDDGSVRDLNPFAFQMLGYEREEVIGRDFKDFGHPDDLSATAAGFALLMGNGASRSAERRYLRKDGHVVTGRTTAAKTTDPFDRITLIATIEDITEERAAQQALAKNQAYLKRLSDSQLVGIAVGNEQSGQIDEANDTFLRMLGYTRADLDNKKLNWKSFTPPEHLQRSFDAGAHLRNAGWSPVLEKEHIRKDGTRIPVLVGLAATDEPGKNVSWTLDISRQKELEKQLLQTQKMEAVGQLAGGIAHDFNNLLMAISGHAELLLEFGPKDARISKTVQTILSATKRGSQLTRKLLAFGRKQELAATEFEVGQFMQEAIDLISPLLSKNIELTFRRDAECWIRADHGQIEQVVVNLVLNARDAMPSGGKIVLSASNVVVSEVEVGLHDTVPAGQYALLKIADTGEGIAPEYIHRIFDPFFTTKGKDRGTGLGLSMVYGAVTQSGGQIRVRSSLNTGTTFCIYLPVVSRPHVEETEREPCSRRGCPLFGTILVVDDEEAIRTSVRAFLEGCGLVAEDASDATEALQKAETLNSSLKILVTDVVMPGMLGSELAQSLRRKHLELPVVFMSGYAAGEQGIGLSNRVAFLQKPFSRAALIKALQRAGECPKGSADCIFMPCPTGAAREHSSGMASRS